MAVSSKWGEGWTQRLHRYHARKAVRRSSVTPFVTPPEPRSIGHFAKGRQLSAGNFLFCGKLVQSPGSSIWTIGTDDPQVVAEVQTCAWLDDLAAVGDAQARDRAQSWVWDWIARYGAADGAGWTPELTGRRLIRWINHAQFLLRGQDPDRRDAFFASLSAQTGFLTRRWKTAAPGLARFEALTGMICAGLSLEGMQDHVAPAVAALAEECGAQIDPGGGYASRNPEELMEIATLLLSARLAMTEAEVFVPAEITSAIKRITPVLRALRHADGGLARFHGGGRGVDGRLDQALAAAGVRGLPEAPLPMGYGRIMAGRTSLIVDGAPPPLGDAAAAAHASTLAFELTTGRRPLIVNCGSGVTFGIDWRRAGRATASHSTLSIDGHSSSRLNAEDLLIDGPSEVICNHHALDDGSRLELAQDGWRGSHGVIHARMLDVTFDGRGVAGEDLLTTLTQQDQAVFETVRRAQASQTLPFSLRFHLHPDVEAQLDPAGVAVTLSLKSGEIWVFEHDGSCDLSLAPTVYLENGRLRPRSAQQMVLSGRAMDYATRVRWSLSKTQDTPNGVRDLGPVGDMEDRGFSEI